MEQGKPGNAKRRMAVALASIAGVAILLVATVLPAEFGKDPLGVGRWLGLTPLGETKSLSPQGEAASTPATVSRQPDGSHRIEFVLRPYGATEIKASMKNGATMTYHWAAGDTPVEFEFHGDRGDDATEATSYAKGTSNSESGRLTAQFDGRHGWYFHNLRPRPVTITVTVKGSIEKIAQV